eukprot:tig00000037_g10102.t1
MPGLTHESRPRWGDDVGDELEDRGAPLPAREEFVDDDGARVIYEYRYNEQNQLVKTTTRIRTVKVTKKINKHVEERRAWKKFGHAKDSPAGPETGITSFGDEIFLETKEKPKKSEEVAAELQAAGKSAIVMCRICGRQGDHWTLKCPFKDKLQPVAGASGVKPGEEKAGDVAGGAGAAAAASLGGKYVTPAARARADGKAVGGDAFGQRGGDDQFTVRVSNLSEDAREADLQDLFRQFGPILRTHVARDRATNVSKGFGFITFVRREDAARAIEKLNGYGYDHLILKVDWARPSGA